LIRVESQRRRRVWAAGALVAAVAAVLASFAFAGGQGGGPGGGGVGGNETGCDHATQSVRKLTSGQVRKATACLLNKERSRHARQRLTPSARLGEVAQSHTEKMVETNCLTHVCANEAKLESRIRRSGYLKGARKWQFAENTGCGSTADAMVRNWMASTFHRINVLGKKFRDVGIGVSDDRVRSRCKRGFGTFTTLFAFRTPKR
jgi:uncharacterized protein YkwD